MEFRTVIPVDRLPAPIRYDDALLSLGSCFAETMGERLTAARFRCDCNPFGTLYNPFSIADALERLLDGTPFTEKELFLHDGCWHSFRHHSRFSDPDREKALQRMNERLQIASEGFSRNRWLLITWGSAFSYRLPDGSVAANCHKLPERAFSRTGSSVAEIVSRWRELLEQLKNGNPGLQFLFTVSPIRHLRDGAHANQLSKSTLLLAVDALCRESENCHYFPGYEIVLDELRDYRFYAPDMLHLSETAVDYIWQRFAESCLDPLSQEAMTAWDALSRRLRHRPMQPESAAYKDFRMQNLLKLKQFAEKFPFFDLRNEGINLSDGEDIST